MTRERIKKIVIVILFLLAVHQTMMRYSDEEQIQLMAKDHANLHWAVEGATECIDHALFYGGPYDDKQLKECRKRLETSGWRNAEDSSLSRR